MGLRDTLQKQTFILESSAGAALTVIGSLVLQPKVDPQKDDGVAYANNATGLTNMVFEVRNGSSAVALANFALDVQVHPGGNAIRLISGATWGTVAGILRHYVGALNTLAAGGAALAYLDIGPIYSLQFLASSAGTTRLANGTFTGNANSWTLGAGWAYGTNNVAATAASSTLKQLKADMGTAWVAGLVYEVSVTISGYAAGSLTCGTNTDPAQGGFSLSANGTYTGMITADGHADGLVFTGNGFTGVVDSISAIEAPTVSVLGSLYR